MIKIFIKLIFACSLIIGNQTKVSAPKIILKNISFDLTFSGSFLKDNLYTLKINNDEFSPDKQTKDDISFKNLTVFKTGEATFVLSQESKKIYEMKKMLSQVGSLFYRLSLRLLFHLQLDPLFPLCLLLSGLVFGQLALLTHSTLFHLYLVRLIHTS